jgi:hypothetical protein
MGDIALDHRVDCSGSSPVPRYRRTGDRASGSEGLATHLPAVVLLDGVVVTPQTAGIVLASGLGLALLAGVPVLRRQRLAGAG